MAGANEGGNGNRSNSQLAGCINNCALCSWPRATEIKIAKTVMLTNLFMEAKL